MLIRHPDSARGSDLYETPEVATLALLRAEPLPRSIWEPACGRGDSDGEAASILGAIVDALHATAGVCR